MESQLDILSKVMISLKEEQTVAMDNVQALLSNRDKETDIVSKIKKEQKELARIESAMSINEFFMIQIAQQSMPKKQEENPKEKGIGSSEDIGSKPPSEK